MNMQLTLENRSALLEVQTPKAKKNKDVCAIINIDPSVLKLVPGFDIHEARMGFYSAKYFSRTSELVSEMNEQQQDVTMQLFQKTNGAVVAGMNLVENLLKLTIGEYKNLDAAKDFYNRYLELKSDANAAWQMQDMDQFTTINQQLVNIKKQLDALWVPAFDKVEIESLVQDGDLIQKYQPVMKIKGPYKYFAVMESVYLGYLARATKVASNSATIVKAANGKPVYFFADRFDNVATQQLDGYAAVLGGCAGVATDAQGFYQNIKGMGTMPHALIASFKGDTSEATLQFARKYPNVPLISLVDFHNNCPKTSLEVAQYVKENGFVLYGVRLDTSGTMVDEGILFEEGLLEQFFVPGDADAIRNEYLENKRYNKVVDNSLFSENTVKKLKAAGLTGVNPIGVRLVREKLDKAGFTNVKIFVSGGFNLEKINRFESEGVPVDGYGVGSSLLTPAYVSDNGDYTADIVRINGKPTSKVGRKEFDKLAA